MSTVDALNGPTVNTPMVLLNGAKPPEAEPTVEALEVRRVRGFRLRRVPSFGLFLQVAGGVTAVAGLYMLGGLAVTLLVVGVVGVVLGALHESELI